jgi:hypothetical protein
VVVVILLKNTQKEDLVVSAQETSVSDLPLMSFA